MSLFFPAEELPVEEIEWDLHRPCNDCPFRKSAPAHTGVIKAIPGYVAMVYEHRFAHTCHKTDNRESCDGPRNWNGRTKHCAGAILMLLKTGNGADLQLALLKALESGKLDLAPFRKTLEEIGDDIFTVQELVEFCRRFVEQKLDEFHADPEVCVVFPEQPDDPPTMVRLSTARAQGLDVLECYRCDRPAIEYDAHWPYHQERNFCWLHGGDWKRVRNEIDDLPRGTDIPASTFSEKFQIYARFVLDATRGVDDTTLVASNGLAGKNLRGKGKRP